MYHDFVIQWLSGIFNLVIKGPLGWFTFSLCAIAVSINGCIFAVKEGFSIWGKARASKDSQTN
jgi:hypothetical protein